MNWPLYLPKPQQTYSTSTDPALITNQFEINMRQRGRYSDPEDKIQVQWIFDQFQFDIFRSFLRHTLENGALPFLVDIIGLDGIESREVRIQDGKFSARYTGFRNYTVTATLIAIAAPPINLGLFDFIISLETSDISEFMHTAEVLELYIETVFGESSANPTTAEFMQLYA